MDAPLLMGIIQCIIYILHIIYYLCNTSHRVRLKNIGEGATFDVRHNQIGLLLISTKIVDVDDICVIKCCTYPGLMDKTSANFRISGKSVR